MKDLNANQLTAILLKNICEVRVIDKDSNCYTPEIAENKYIPLFCKPDTSLTFKAGAKNTLETGFNIKLEKGYEGEIRNSKCGLTVTLQYIYPYDSLKNGIKVEVANNTNKDILIDDETPYAEIHFTKSCLPEIK